MIQLAKRFLLIYLLLKPFYLFSSGGLQIADAFLILSFGLLLLSLKIHKKTRREFMDIIRSNGLFLLFVSLTLAINTIYFLYIGEFRFILSSLYFIFNLLAILTFSSFYRDKVFLQNVSKVFKFNLILQLIIFLTGMGRYYSPDRYMGTFNDPNQFGYFILISFFFIYIIKILLSKKENNTLFLLLSIFLIFQCASTGMLLGVALFIVLISVYHLRKNLRITYQKIRKAIYAVSLIILLLIPALMIALHYPINSNSRESDDLNTSQSVLKRVSDKFSKAEGDSDITIWEDRGYDIITKYPVYILYGAGEGAYTRFSLATNNFESEIHATLPSILFYYGIVPFLILLRWLYLKLKDSDPRILIAIVAIFAESFTLLNQRQSLFWMIIVLAGLYSRKTLAERTYETR